MRYYVYSVDTGHAPNNPIHESDDLVQCKKVCDMHSTKHDASTYVVDRLKKRFEEVYVRVSSKFTQRYLETQDALEKLKH